MTTAPTRIRSTELAELRARVDAATGKRTWRSLEELAESPEFLEYLHREFPEQASELTDPVSRRRFLQLMGASLALAGTTACTGQPPERIVPFVRQPEDLIPGKPLRYASALTFGGYAEGVLVESHMGRPTKIEGNALHPANLGGSDSLMQAAVLDLYDPDRSDVVIRNGRITTWEAFLSTMTTAMSSLGAGGGAGLRLLTPTVTSPTLREQIGRLLERHPAAHWHQYEAAARDSVVAGAEAAFGASVETRYRFDRARLVVALDADFLAGMPGCNRYARDFSAARRVRGERREMTRLYAVESTPTLTGAMADHRWRLRARDVELFARALAAELGVPGQRGAATARADLEALDTGVDSGWISALADDLRGNAGASLIVPGEAQTPALHALAHAINASLGNVGETVVYTEPVTSSARQGESLAELVEAMRADEVGILVMLDVNPVYDAPADLDFAAALENVDIRAHLGLYDDETAQLSHWHVPMAHPLEAWGDARAWDGTASIVQPLIEPLYDGRSAVEMLAVLLGDTQQDGHEIVREAWRRRWETGEAGEAGEVRETGETGEPSGDATSFEAFWQTSLHDGVVAGSALATSLPALVPGWDRGPTPPPGDGLEIVFRPDPTIGDGRHANNGWLQETPKPHTKLTWDNAALLSPATAERLGLGNEDRVELTLDGRRVFAPVWILPGQADESITVHLGHGRDRAGRIGAGRGFDAYRLRRSSQPWFDAGLEVRRIGGRYRLATTQHHHSMEGRDIVRHATLAQFLEDGEVHGHAHEPGPEESMYPPYEYEGYSWGMSIDLNACIGCNGCVTACQAENNVPIVGKDEVLNGREMHWIRIDRYWAGDVDDPQTLHQPVACVHCENAPCEVVCPVAATVHGPEGLNEMVYNRCVGTRYCANNCPYKVRRFNFLEYADYRDTPTLHMLQNPDVTVRSRGVMEKCTYCVQRINAARIDAKKDDREIEDGDIVTACQQACPAEAISFGNLNDEDSEIARLQDDPRRYSLLAELGTRPRTTYLAKLTNPNPAIDDRHDEAGDEH